MPKVYEADITELVKPHYEKGLQEGLQQGLQEGEFKAKIETAKKMKKEGLSLDLIIKITGLSKKDLKKHGIIS
jgi:predicted transposase/invertase (TIGR01784 family)